MMKTHVRRAAVLACLFLAACGGGGSGSTGGSSGSGSGSGSAGGTLTGPSSNPSPCAPNLCVDFAYPLSAPARQLTGTVRPATTQALVGYSSHYSLTSGALPEGMSLDATTGAIHGTPTTDGFYDATIQLTVSGYSGSLSTHLSMQVIDPTLNYFHSATPIGPQDVATPATVPFFLVGTALKDGALSLSSPSANGETLDTGPNEATHFTYSVIGAQGLPPGLTLDTASGAISGTPTQAGVWLVQVQAVATTAGASTTYTGWAPFGIGPVIQEHAGQAAAAPMQMAVHVAAGVNFTGNVVQYGGNPSTSFTFDESTNVMTITPAAVPAGATPSISISDLVYWIVAPNGATAYAGFVEQVS